MPHLSPLSWLLVPIMVILGGLSLYVGSWWKGSMVFPGLRVKKFKGSKFWGW